MSELDNPVEEVRSMSLMGTNAMVGIHADGEEELRLWNSSPINPSTAADMDPRTWGGDDS
jgi:hypothetical protein